MGITGFLFFTIMVTFISGGVGYLVWGLFEKVIGSKYPQFCYSTLKMTSFFLFLPVIALMVLRFHTGRIRNYDSIWRCEFDQTEVITKGMVICTVIWLLFVLKSIYIKWKAYRKWKKLLTQNVEMKNCEAVSREVKQALHICKELKICQNPLIKSPVIYGVIHPVVLLPQTDYTTDELKMILFHEFSHYKNADLVWKYFLSILLIFHSLNPCSRQIQESFNKWGEICCDLTVKEYSRGYFTMREYYSMILEQIEKNINMTELKYAAPLFERKCEMEERVKAMQRAIKFGKPGRRNTVCLSGIFLFTFLLATYSSGVGVQAGAEALYFETEEVVDVTDQYTPPEEIDYIEEEDDLSGYQIVEMPENVSRSTNNMNWKISAKSAIVSSYFTLKKGDTIKLRIVITPDNQKVQAGYQKKDKKAVTVEGKDYITHTFKVSSAGKYRICIKNLGSKTVTVSGSYSK